MNAEVMNRGKKDNAVTLIVSAMLVLAVKYVIADGVDLFATNVVTRVQNVCGNKFSCIGYTIKNRICVN